MADPRGRLVVPAASRARPQLEIPFRVGDTPFTAEAVPLLHNGAAREICVIAWSGAARYGSDAAFDVDARLLDAAGASRSLPVEGAPRVVEDADGMQRYVLTVSPKGIPAGRYTLEMGFRDKASGATTRVVSAAQVD
jgi:hypothetical protein